MSERIILTGSISERIVQALTYAGWYPERKVDIKTIENYYRQFGLTLNDKANLFLAEYYGIKSKWYIEVSILDHGADFEFDLFPYSKAYGIDVVDFMFDDAEYKLESHEYTNVLQFAPEGSNPILVGEIGYYYPARVWIDTNGKIYATHEYNENVLVFESVIELIEHELTGHDFSSVAMK